MRLLLNEWKHDEELLSVVGTKRGVISRIHQGAAMTEAEHDSGGGTRRVLEMKDVLPTTQHFYSSLQSELLFIMSC